MPSMPCLPSTLRLAPCSAATEAGAGVTDFTVAQPKRIVAAITPFNFPLNLVVHQNGPAIAAGCPVVLKPSDRARLTANQLTEAFVAAGISVGNLNLVTGPPREIVDAWQHDERVVAAGLS